MTTVVRPRSVEEAAELLEANPWDSRLVAGGTAIALMMRQGLVAPSILVSLDRIPDLGGISLEGDRLRIGAMCTLSDIARSQLVREHVPTLAKGCEEVANVRVRNMATIGGNLAEADYASDPPAILVSLRASCATRGATSRELPVSDLITGMYATSLEAGEVVTAVSVPLTPGGQSVYLKFRTRSSEDRPCVGVALSAQVEEGSLMRIRLVVGAVAGNPQWFPDVVEPLIGSTVAERSLVEVADEYARRVDPIDDLRGSAWYRRQLVRSLSMRALRELLPLSER